MKKTIFITTFFLFFATSAFAEPKVRVFYNPDGSVRIQGMFDPQENTAHYDRSLETNQIPDLQGLPYEDIEISKLPLGSNKKDENRDKWRGAKGQGVRIDHSIKLPREQIEELNQELDAELAKPEPNPVEVIKIKREIEKILGKK